MSSVDRPSRREILKTFTLLTASSVLLGRNWVATVLAQVVPTQGGVLRIRISDYPALQQANGSVRIGTSALAGTGMCPRSQGLFAPVLINRGAGDQFFALDSSCSHEGCVVPVYSAGLGYSQCPNHGSRYTIDGTSIRGPLGGPPIAPLVSFTTRFDGVDTLTVENPDWSIELTTLGVQSGAGGRLSLRFIAFANIQYEVRYRDSLGASDNPVNFALTPGGPADQSVLPGVNDFVTVYVDRAGPAGFYSIAMRTQEV